MAFLNLRDVWIHLFFSAWQQEANPGNPPPFPPALLSFQPLAPHSCLCCFVKNKCPHLVFGPGHGALWQPAPHETTNGYFGFGRDSVNKIIIRCVYHRALDMLTFRSCFKPLLMFMLPAAGESSVSTAQTLPWYWSHCPAVGQIIMYVLTDMNKSTSWPFITVIVKVIIIPFYYLTEC